MFGEAFWLSMDRLSVLYILPTLLLGFGFPFFFWLDSCFLSLFLFCLWMDDLGIANDSWSRVYFVEDNFCDWYRWGDSSSIQFSLLAPIVGSSPRGVLNATTQYSCPTYLECVHSNICLLINMPQLFHLLKNARKRELTE